MEFLRTLRWAIHAMRHGTLLVNKTYTEPYKMYVPGVDVPIDVQPGQRAEIILYPAGK